MDLKPFGTTPTKEGRESFFFCAEAFDITFIKQHLRRHSI